MTRNVDRSQAVRLHVTQDESGHWMESFEMPNGELYLTKFGIEHPEHDIADAKDPAHLVSVGYLRSIEVWVSSAPLPLLVGEAGGKPAPARAREPYKVYRAGKQRR